MVTVCSSAATLNAALDRRIVSPQSQPGETSVQALIELIAGFIALLAASALSQFGVDLHSPPKPEREVRRISDCGEPPARTVTVTAPKRRC